MPERNPWLLRPFFGTTPVLPTEARHILRLVAIGLFFESYDMGLINAALPQIAEDLSIAPGDTGFYMGAIRLGGIGTFLLLPLADRLGRRRLFIAAFAGMSIGTIASGLAMTPAQFVTAQVVARAFMLVATSLALVIVVEEFPAEHRGAGLGLLTILGGLGYGTCALLYSMVASLPLGWRSLYLIGLLPLLFLPWLARALPETRRFKHHESTRTDRSEGWLRAWLSPIESVVRTNPRRLFAVAGAALFSAIGGIGFYQYTSYFVQEVHGWSPAGYSGLVLLGGGIGVLGNVVGGRGSDRIGRRKIGPAGFALAPLFAFLFYFGPGWSLVVAWGLFVFCSSASDVVLRALSAELFPTSQRGASTGWLTLVQTLGWTTGLVVIGLGTGSIEELGQTVAFISLALVVAGAALFLVPETRGRELESLSEESS
jgi:MFS family permease